MKLRNIGSNQTEIWFDDGTLVLFSYDTPVAAWTREYGYVKTNVKHSRTTSKHINAWLDGRTAKEVDQATLDKLGR